MKFAKGMMIALFVLGGLVGANCSAQENSGTISGKVVDDQTRAPLSPARIELVSESQRKIVASSVTQGDGTFEFLQVPFGEYRMAVSCAGYLDGEVERIELSQQDPRIILGDMPLVENVVLLDEITVTQQKLTGVEELGRTVFTVNDDIRNASSSGLEVLRYIPSVTVDFLENVTLEGKSDIQFYVDGVQRSKEFVSQLDPQKIDRVELITNPSVKYDADISGVISIVLKEEQREGFHGMVKVPFSNPDKIMIEPAASLEYSFSNFRLFAGEKLYDQEWDAEETVLSLWNEASGASGRFEKEETYRYKWERSYFDYGIDWFINDRTELNFLGEWRFWEYDPGDQVSESLAYVDDMLSQYYTTTSDSKDRNDNHYLSLFFRRELDQEGCDFTVEAYVNQEDYESDFEYSDIFYNTNDLATIIDTISGTESTDDLRKTAQLKMDYSFLLGKVKNEVGMRSFRGRAESESTESVLQVGSPESAFDEFAYNEWRQRIYYNAMGEWGQVKWQLGGSGEYDQVVIDGAEDLDDFYFLPQVSLQRDFGPKGSLKFSYKRSIERPQTYQLRPFETVIDPLHVRSGNPDLKAEEEDALELSWSKNFNSNYVAPELYLNYTGNAIQDVTTLRSDGVFETTRENVGKHIEYGLGLVASLQMTKFWRFSGYLSAFNREIRSGSALDGDSEEKASYLISATNIFSLPKDFTLALVTYYPSPNISYRTEKRRDLFFLVDLGKKITKRLEMNVVCFPFANYGNETIVSYPDFYEKTTMDIDTQGWFVVSFKYTFDYGAETEKIERDTEYEMLDQEGVL